MNLCLKNVNIINDVMSKLKKTYGFIPELIFTEFGDLALSIEYKFEKHKLVEEVFIFNIQPELGKNIKSYCYEWIDEEYNLRGSDVCRLVIKLKF